MADRIEREIEEILERLEKKGKVPAGPQPPSGAGREPIAFTPRRRRRSIASRIASAFSLGMDMTPANLLFVGAGVMIVGFVLATFWEPFIWLSLGGVGIFLFAFVWSFFRRPGRRIGAPPERYWRGQRIEYDAPHAGPITRFKRIFRRR